MKSISIHENGLYLELLVTEKNNVKLLHFSSLPFNGKIEADAIEESFNLVELDLAGFDRPLERHGNKYIITAPGFRMQYVNHKDYRNKLGRKLEVALNDPETDVAVTVHIQFYDGISTARFKSVVKNNGSHEQTLTYISSFNLCGISKEGLLPRDRKLRLHIPHNGWQREMEWQSYSLEQLGFVQTQPDPWQHSSKTVAVTNVGNWSTKEYLPLAIFENTEASTALFWQVENNGSWHWEISDHKSELYLAVCGPSEIESHWSKQLKPDDEFETVTVAVGSVFGAPLFDLSIAELTKYRRQIRRKNNDNETLAVIFNDYMNCLWGCPTTQAELPLIDAAAEIGCEYFCIDCGWYADDSWWDSVGEWQESKKRFPNGLREVTDYIRKKGMIPGVWLEIEVMGINCSLASTLPDECFFMRHGKRIYDRSRFQLDFSNPLVTEFADNVVDRLINDYGVGYIKMDYNIEPGIGTENGADSYGDGLLRHQRAYLAWLDQVFERHPDLIIENCSSGGMRIDYAMLSRYSIQSTSDQDKYLYYSKISANAPAALTPEQAAAWTFPLVESSREEVVYNMINAMLLRIHQSGHLANIPPDKKQLIKEAINCYKNYRADIKNAVPFWPLGIAHEFDDWQCLGLDAGEKLYIAVWRKETSDCECILPLPKKDKKLKQANCIYPSYMECEFTLNNFTNSLAVKLPLQNSARLFEIKYQ